MSTVVDQRVVQMQFDNKQFESGVSTTMSTIDKLKQKLNFTGASKGLENVNTAAKNVNMTGLTAAVQTVQSKFSAMEVVGVTALANITNSAVNAGKRIISALTIDPVKTGFQEYETQINSTQTILANTASKGSTIEDVNRALEELNLYADKTIYNFTEMTRNIGTFTAAGIELETATNAIQGIANLAAVSGSTSQQASTAMYQLSQALASGTVKLMDWNSVVNAGMGGEMFQNALKETSRLLGTGADAAIEASGSFRESLRDGWLTSEVLTETLKKFTTTGANEYIAEYTGLTLDAVEAETKRIATAEDSAAAIDKAAEALAKASGKSKDEIKNALQFAQTAEDAATKVKTFTQLWDVMKESAQSGWSQTWKIIVGDFEEAKALLTPLADTLTGFINKMSNARNFIVEGVLDFAAPWTALTEKLSKVQEVAKTVTNVTDKLEYFQKVVNDVWRGDYKNSDTGRFELLEKAGYDHRVVQDLVNKGYQYKITVEDIEASHKKFGLTMETTTEETKAVTDALAGLDEETLRNAGLTEDEIRLYKDLEKGAKKYGMTVDELAKKMSETSGRDLLVESFKNIGNSIINVFKAIGNAWGEIFEPVSIVNLYMMLEAFRDWTKSLNLVDEKTGELNETGKKIQSTFKGIFAIVDILATVMGGGLRIAFKLLSSILGYFGMSILDVTAFIGEAIVRFRDWFDSLFDVSGALDIIVPALKNGVKAIKGWIDTIKKLPGVQKFTESITNLFDKLSSVKIGNIGIFDKLLSFINKLMGTNFESIGEFITDGLIKGLGNGILKVVDFIANLATTLIEKFCEITDIASPSKVFMALGGFIIAGLISGISQGLISVPESLQGIVDKCIQIIQGIDWGTIMALGISVAGLVFLKKIGDALNAIASPLEGLGDILENTGELIKSFGKVTKAAAFNVRMKGIKQLAIAIAIITGAIIALVYFGGDDYAKMWNAVGIVTVLALVLAGLSIAMSKLSDSSVSIEKGKFSLSGFKSGLLTMAAAIAVLSVVIKLVGTLDREQAIQGFVGLGIIMAAILGFVKLCQIVTKGDVSANVDRIGTLMIRLGIAMALMVGVCKLIGMLSPGEMIKGAAFAAGFAIFVIAISKVAKSAGNNVGKVGGMMIKLGIAMALMVGVCKLIDLLEPLEAIKAGIFALAFMGFVRALVKITTIGKKQQIAKLGGLLLSISFSMMLMVGVCKLVDTLSGKEMLKGAAFAAGFAVFVGALVAILKIGNEQQIAKVAGTIIAISLSVGILAAVATMIGILPIDHLIKGVVAISVLCSMMALMIHSLSGIQGSEDITKSLTMMAVTIALMAVAVAGLSFIDPKRLAGATVAMSVLMGIFALMIKTLGTLKGVGKITGVLVVMAVVVGLLGGILWALSALNVKSSLSNAAALSVLLLAMTGVLVILSKIKIKAVDALKGIGLLTLMAVPMMAFVAVLHFMPDISKTKDNVILLIGLMTAMTALLGILTIIGTFGLQALVGVGLLTLMAVPMMAFVAVLHFMPDISKTKDNVILLIGLMTAMTALLGILTIIGTFGLQALVGVGLLTLMVVPMMAFVAVLHFMPDISKATENVKLLIGVMTVMTVLLGILTVIGFGAIAALAGIISLTAMVLPMLAFTWAIRQLDGLEESKANIILMLDLMTTMTDLLVKLALVGPMALIGVVALAGLTLLIAALGTMIIGLGALNNITNGGLEKLIDSGIPLLIKLAEGIGTMIGKFVSSCLTSITASLPQIGTDLSNFMSNAAGFISGVKMVDESVIDGTKRLAAAIVLLSAAEFVNGITKIMPGGTSLSVLGTELSNFMINALPFIAYAKLIDQSVVESAKMLAQVILTLTAADLISGIASLMPGKGELNFDTLGTQLTAFAEAMVGFSNAITENGGINTEAIDAACTAGELMVELQKSLPRTGGWVQEVMGEKDLKSFSKSCLAFGQAMVDFSKAVVDAGGINVEAIQDAADAGTLMSELQKSLPKTGGWLQEICGEQDLEMFGDSCVEFAKCMTGFCRAVEEGGGIDESIAKEASKAGTIMVELQKALPKTGGWIQEIAGEQDLETFGDSIKEFGKAMTDFCENTTIDENAVALAKNAGLMMAELQDAIPEDKWFDGKVSLDDFGDKIETFGEKLVDYSDEVEDLDSEAVANSIIQAKNIVSLVKSLVDLDMSGVDDFKVKKIGEAMKDYSDKVEDIDEDVVASSVSSAKQLVSLIKSLVGIDNSGVALFSVKSIGEKMKAYADAVAGIDATSISSSISAANRLKNFIASLAGLDTSGVGSFKSAVAELGTVQVGNITKAFSAAIPSLVGVGSSMITAISQGMNSKRGTLTATVSGMITNLVGSVKTAASTFSTAGTTLMTKFISGINSKKTAVTAAINVINNLVTNSSKKVVPLMGTTGAEAMSKFAEGLRSQNANVSTAMSSGMTAAVTTARGHYSSFYSAGSYLVDGFKSGISANSYKAVAQASAMATAAKEAAEKALGIKSPSRVFYKIGEFVIRGFNNALSDGNSETYEAGSTMADYARKGLTNAIGKIQEVINSDMDTQPTIRPVLDLSDVRSGAAAISGMFSDGASVGVMANVNSISSMMNDKIQNGVNSDVVSAINKLRSDMSNVGGTTYSINGITYDDGSNISDAIKTIARVAKMERRI